MYILVRLVTKITTWNKGLLHSLDWCSRQSSLSRVSILWIIFKKKNILSGIILNLKFAIFTKIQKKIWQKAPCDTYIQSTLFMSNARYIMCFDKLTITESKKKYAANCTGSKLSQCSVLSFLIKTVSPFS